MEIREKTREKRHQPEIGLEVQHEHTADAVDVGCGRESDQPENNADIGEDNVHPVVRGEHDRLRVKIYIVVSANVQKRIAGAETTYGWYPCGNGVALMRW